MLCFLPETMTEKIIESDRLPEIVADLLHASYSNFNHFRIPQTNLSGHFGFDGEIETDSNFVHPYISSGKVVFEMGINKEVKAKFESDYNARKINTSKDTTFIFITPRLANNASDWCKEKKSEIDFAWKDIRVIEQVALYEWFKMCPVVAHKWAERWGYKQTEIYTLERVWERWSCAFEEKIPFSLVAALGVKSKHEASSFELMKNFIEGVQNKFIVTASSVDEARLYLSSLFLSEEYFVGNNLINKVICLDTRDAFQVFFGQKQADIIVVTPLQDADIINEARSCGAKIIQVLRATKTREHVDISLPLRINEINFSEELSKIGIFTFDEIETLAKKSGRNLTLLRSIVGKEPLHWMKENPSKALLAALLVGGWCSDYEDDKQVMCQLSGTATYRDFTDEINKYIKIENPPIQNEGAYYRTLSSFSSFIALEDSLTDEFIADYKAICINILTKSDKIKILPEKEQMYAQFDGINNDFSYLLRTSIAESLIHISILYEDNSNKYSPSTDVVKAVCTGSIENWKSISPFISELAEAAPKAFLEALKKSILQQKSKLKQLVNEDFEFMQSSGVYTNILFALEALAWQNEYLNEVTTILFELLPIWDNIPKNLLNSPLSTLRQIFCSWCPQTSATVTQRNILLNELSHNYPKKMPLLLKKLLPDNTRGTLRHSTKPQWRWDVLNDNNEITRDDYFKSVKTIIRLSLPYVNSDLDIFLKIMRAGVNNLIFDEEKQLFLNSIDFTTLSDEKSFELWNKLRHEIVYFCRYDKENIDKVFLAEITARYSLLEPQNITQKYAHYFYDLSNVIETASNKEYYKKLNPVLAQIQDDILEKIYSENGREGIIKLLETVSLYVETSNYWLRESLEKIIKKLFTLSILEKDCKTYFDILVAKGIKSFFIEMFMLQYIQTCQNSALKSTFSYAQGCGDEFFKYYLNALPVTKELLLVIAEQKEDVQFLFWSSVNTNALAKVENHKSVLDSLSKFKEFTKAAKLLACDYKDIADFETIFVILDGLFRNDIKAIAYIKHDIPLLFDRMLCENEEQKNRLIALEWAYFPLLQQKAKRLYSAMVESPEFFMEFISASYRPSEKSEGYIKVEEHIAKKAYDLLDGDVYLQKRSPLLDAFRRMDGSLSEEKLQNWYANISEIAKIKFYERVINSVIGKHFAYSDKDTDGIWPEKAIRGLLNQSENRLLRDAFNLSFTNRHGIWMGSAVEHYQGLYHEVENNKNKIDEENLYYFSQMLSSLLGSLKLRIDDSKKLERIDDIRGQ